MKKPKKILIAGGGFGGIYAFQTLRKSKEYKKRRIDITLVSNSDSFFFLPLAHEIATGNLTPQSLSQPIRNLIDGCHFIEGTIKSVSPNKKEVSILTPRSTEIIKHKYDYLILALGSKTNYRNILGAKENSIPLYSLSDSRKVKNKIISSFESAKHLKSPEEIRKRLTFVIVGGGPTGVELVSEVADYIGTELSSKFRHLSDKCSIKLIHSGNKLLKPMNEWFHERVVKVLERYNVEVITNARVTKIEKGSLEYNNQKIYSDNIFWTAGMSAKEIEFIDLGISKDQKTNRIKVNHDLQIPNTENIFVVGDMAYICDLDKRQPYPMRAQFAVKEGITAAKNIIQIENNKETIGFKWKDKGFIISLGRGKALAQVYGIKFEGKIAWFFYRTAYLFKIPGLKTKIRAGVEWAFDLIFPRDVSGF